MVTGDRKSVVEGKGVDLGGRRTRSVSAFLLTRSSDLSGRVDHDLHDTFEAADWYWACVARDVLLDGDGRSEERRGGKGGRSRGAPYEIGLGIPADPLFRSLRPCRSRPPRYL